MLRKKMKITTQSEVACRVLVRHVFRNEVNSRACIKNQAWLKLVELYKNLWDFSNSGDSDCDAIYFKGIIHMQISKMEEAVNDTIKSIGRKKMKEQGAHDPESFYFQLSRTELYRMFKEAAAIGVQEEFFKTIPITHSIIKKVEPKLAEWIDVYQKKLQKMRNLSTRQAVSAFAATIKDDIEDMCNNVKNISGNIDTADLYTKHIERCAVLYYLYVDNIFSVEGVNNFAKNSKLLYAFISIFIAFNDVAEMLKKSKDDDEVDLKLLSINVLLHIKEHLISFVDLTKELRNSPTIISL